MNNPIVNSDSKSDGFDTFIVFYLGPNIKEFCHIFRGLGIVPGVNVWYFCFN